MLANKQKLRKIKNRDILKDRTTNTTFKLIKLVNKVGKLK